MNRRYFFALAVAGFFFAGLESRAAIEDVRRLYDLTPVSTNNPVLASVKECGIEIPVSEFRGFVNSAFLPGKEGKIMSAAEKRAELQKLLDDYFWIWDGFSHDADKTPDIQGMLAITRNEAMKALLVEQEADAKVTSLEEYEKFKQEIRRELFDKAEIHVSSKAYEILKSTIKAAGTNEFVLSPEAQSVPLATSKAGTVGVGKFLEAYFEIPPTNRPDLTKQENVVGILRDIISEDLLLAAAHERGLDQAAPVRTQVQADSTGLVREWALDQVTREVQAKMDAPGAEKQLKRWYQAHRKTLYTKKDE
ncbi:MAG TPA: hypothetical protein VN516_10790, partial [Candidatus Baltobacteraceae bacterium]|nr:hypothetical protein [Candidatus Baltobacteraceae bacterium]